jgi:hypothetical protein
VHGLNDLNVLSFNFLVLNMKAVHLTLVTNVFVSISGINVYHTQLNVVL